MSQSASVASVGAAGARMRQPAAGQPRVGRRDAAGRRRVTPGGMDLKLSNRSMATFGAQAEARQALGQHRRLRRLAIQQQRVRHRPG